MKQKIAPSRPHYAWWILLACCLIQGGIMGLVQNCRGIFYGPVCGELGFTVSAFTLYSTAHGFASVVIMPLAGRMLLHCPLRAVLATATLVFSGSTALMGCLSTLAQWYVVGAVQGMAGAFLIFLPIPILLNNWFHRRFGLAMGVSASISGLVGVIANPVWSRCIESFGWRNGYFLLGGACFLMVMPAVLFLVVRSPADRGTQPYGAEPLHTLPQPAERTAESNPVSDTVVGRKGLSKGERTAFFCAVAFAACMGFTCSYCQHYANYGSSLGYSATLGAALVSASMVGNIVGKLCLGAAGDRFGVEITNLVSSALVGASFLVMMIPQMPALMGGALFSGLSMSMSIVCVPMLVKALFSIERYGELFSYVTMATSLATSVSLAIIGATYDLFASYIPALWLGGLLCAVCILLVWIAFRAVGSEKPSGSAAS